MSAALSLASDVVLFGGGGGPFARIFIGSLMASHLAFLQRGPPCGASRVITIHMCFVLTSCILGSAASVVPCPGALVARMIYLLSPYGVLSFWSPRPPPTFAAGAALDSLLWLQV